MPKLLIFDAFTLLICEKNVAIYALLRCKIFSLKIWVCKILDKFHVCREREILASFSYFVANLLTFWPIFYKPNNAVRHQK